MKLPPNYLYVALDVDARQQLYEQWCQENKLDPETESACDQFFQAIDRIQQQPQEEPSCQESLLD